MTGDQLARSVMAAHAATSLIPDEHQAIRAVDDITGAEAARLARLSSRLGDVAYCVMHGTSPLEDHLLTLAATALAWIEDIGRERAR